MLKKFSVKNFRGFKDEVSICLDTPNSYEYNTDMVDRGLVKDALVYGYNASGKSAFLMALSDISVTLSDHMVSDGYLNGNFKNLHNSLDENVSFSYVFDFDGVEVEYQYLKSEPRRVVYEKLSVSGETILTRSETVETNERYFPELKNLDVFRNFDHSQSVVKYLSRIGLKLKESYISEIASFADRFLFFRSVMNERSFTGFNSTPESMLNPIQRNNALKDFQDFLHENGIEYELELKMAPSGLTLLVVFPSGSLDFFQVASSGTQYLLLLYSWLLTVKDHCSLLCIDEFDSYYHDDLARSVFRHLKKEKYQIILSTHKTALMQTSISRPDCVYLMQDGTLKQLSKCTNRELREANNIEKLYRSKAFYCE